MEVYSPHEDRESTSIDGFLACCEFILREAEVVIVLPGWSGSKGAHAEVALAFVVGKPIYEFHPETGIREKPVTYLPPLAGDPRPRPYKKPWTLEQRERNLKKQVEEADE